MENSVLEPTKSKIARFLAAAILLAVGFWWLSAITVTPSPSVIIIVSVILFLCAVGLFLKLLWASLLSIILLFTLVPFMSLMWLPSRGSQTPANFMQNIIGQLSTEQLWSFYMAVISICFVLAYILSTSKSYYKKGWY